MNTPTGRKIWLAEADADCDVNCMANRAINENQSWGWLAEAEAETEAPWWLHRWLAEAEAEAGSKMPMEWLKKAGKNLWENRDEIAEGLEQGADWAEEFAGSAYDTAAPVVANVVDEVKSRFPGWLAEHGEEAM